MADLPCFPMTRSPSQWPATSARHLGGPVLDGPHAADLRARALLPAAGFALLAAGAQDDPVLRQFAFRRGVDPGVNGLVRHGHPGFSPMPLIAQPARYLLRRPAFLQVAGQPLAQFRLGVYFAFLRAAS